MVGASAFPGDVHLNRVHANVSILPLLRKKVVVDKLELEGPEVKWLFKQEAMVGEHQQAATPLSPPMETETGVENKNQPSTSLSETLETNNHGVVASESTPRGVQLPVEIKIDQLSIKVKRLELEDTVTVPGQTIVNIFNDVDLAAANVVAGEEMTFNLSLHNEAESGIGMFNAQGTFSGLTDTLTLKTPNLIVKAAIRGLHADAFKPYLAESPLGKNISGTVSLKVDYETDLSTTNYIDGELDLSELKYTDLTVWDAPIPGQQATLAFRGTLDPHDILVEQMALKIGGLSLGAKADVEAWDKNPLIKNAVLSYVVPLEESIPFVPWKLLREYSGIIRPILEGGGNIKADKVLIPEITLSNFPPNVDDVLSGIDMVVQVTGVSAQPSPKLPKMENINGTVQLVNGIAHLKGFRSQFGSVILPEVSAQVSNLTKNPKIEADILGRLQLDDNFQTEFGKVLQDIEVEKLTGEVDVDLAVELSAGRPKDVVARGSIGLSGMLIKTAFSPAVLQGLNADIDISPDAARISGFSSMVALEGEAVSPDERFKLELNGRIDDLCRNPAITLEGLKTSPVSLSLLAAMLPWKKLGPSAKPVKEILVSGGTLTMENLTLPKVDLSEPLKDRSRLISKVRLIAGIDDLTVPPIKNLPGFNGIKGRINLENDVLVADNVSAEVGPVSLPTINVRATKISSQPKWTVNAKGPLQVAATSSAGIEKLLKKYGLKTLTGSGFIDMRAYFDQAEPKKWKGSGSLVLDGVRAETYPAAAVMEDLKGSLEFHRNETMDLTAKDVTALINQSPIGLSGTALGIGTPKMSVTASAYAKQLNLADLGELFPTLKDLQLGGILDMDVSAYVPYDSPKSSQLHGTLAIRHAGFRLAEPNLSFEKVNSRLELAGQNVDIKIMTMHLNEQQVVVSGQISNPVEPNVHLLIRSPDLNLDRLIPEGKGVVSTSKSEKSETSEQERETPPEVKTGPHELPSRVQKLTADIQVNAEQGRYRRLQFKKLNLTLHYAHGVIESYHLNFGTDNGQIDNKGSADLHDLDHIAYVAEPDIQAMDLEKMASVYEIKKSFLTGPMSLSGQLSGRTGNKKELLGSLNGQLNTLIGPGRIKNVGKVGTLFAKIFSMASLQSIFSGRMLEDLSGEGISFNSITAQTSFEKGVLNLNSLFKSNVMNINTQGTIDLVTERINTTSLLEPLATVNKALEFVPILGKAAGDLIKIRIDVQGPLDNPKIETSQIKQVGTAIESAIKGPGNFLKDIGKGVKGLFGK
jgi:hypothetical protein